MIELSDLHPPETKSSTELVWLLNRAFARDSPPFPSDLDTGFALSLAHELDLTERIGSRLTAAEPDGGEGTDIPPDLSDGFRLALARSAAIALLYEETARAIATAARQLETPVVFLKGLALSLAGTTPPGARAFGDIDILVPEPLAEGLFGKLVDEGYDPSPAEATEQHLPELRPPRGGSLEIHFSLRGIQDENSDPATLSGLRARGALVPFPNFVGECFTPEPSLLAAHVLVHGFQQHLLRPRTYPLFRMIGDLLDLLAEAGDWSHVEDAWHDSIAHTVSKESFHAVRSLCADLSAGTWPESPTSAALLLRHLIAGATDRDYAETLKKTYLRQRLAEARSRGELGSYLKRKLRPLFGLKRLSRGS